MSSEQNNCAGLQFNMKKSEDWDIIFNLQKSLQDKLETNFEGMSIDEIAKFNMKNEHAMQDEHCEFMDALGGINNGIGNAGWKWWKANNAQATTMILSDLSDSDLLELKFEVVDMFHFLINKALSVGMTGSEVFSMYISKNKENFDRQKNGY